MKRMWDHDQRQKFSKEVEEIKQVADMLGEDLSVPSKRHLNDHEHFQLELQWQEEQKNKRRRRWFVGSSITLALACVIGVIAISKEKLSVIEAEPGPTQVVEQKVEDTQHLHMDQTTVAVGRPTPASERYAANSFAGRIGKGFGGFAFKSSSHFEQDIAHHTEAYEYIAESGFKNPTQTPLSTFSIDVDTASYSNIRRFLNMNQKPPKDAVRIEELLNYFTYETLPQDGKHPFATKVEIAQAPWNSKNKLVRVMLQSKPLELAQQPPSNLVFLIDVSGSMQDPNKLPLVKGALKLLVDNLRDNDRVAISVYAGAAGLALPSTPGHKKGTILAAIDELEAGGSTNGAQGIELAYRTAQENFIKGGTNRVVLLTDGDFNVGTTSQGDLVRLITEKAKSGVYLSVLGFGMGNLKDSTMEQLADKGNGNYGYIDSLKEAKKVFVEQMGATLITVAKDVKIQVEFNPQAVESYRLIGYENRALHDRDFNDDKKDAGEMGAGHAVTALYEIVPAGGEAMGGSVDALKYQRRPTTKTNPTASGEILTLKVRYKKPTEEVSQLIETPIMNSNAEFETASSDFKFAAAVAEFGMLLRGSEHLAQGSYAQVKEIAKATIGKDTYREEFLDLVKKAEQ